MITTRIKKIEVRGLRYPIPNWISFISCICTDDFGKLEGSIYFPKPTSTKHFISSLSVSSASDRLLRISWTFLKRNLMKSGRASSCSSSSSCCQSDGELTVDEQTLPLRDLHTRGKIAVLTNFVNYSFIIHIHKWKVSNEQTLFFAADHSMHS